MNTSLNRAVYNERRLRLARLGISIPDLFGQDSPAVRDPGEWLADQEAGVARAELTEILDREKPWPCGSR